MLTAKELFMFSEEGMVAAGLVRGGLTWDQVTLASRAYYEKMAELVNAHFTGAATAPTDQPLAYDALELVSKLPEDKQFLVYKFLHNFGHRIYK